ncbi:hypothetical protein K474DRAFT_1714183 [Panus rudis PR-1116 ss-1]|nr:hypothetical protein K474DRAFT_1714183 [Panus rudis PR-1116 ss-1]
MSRTPTDALTNDTRCTAKSSPETEAESETTSASSSATAPTFNSSDSRTGSPNNDTTAINLAPPSQAPTRLPPPKSVAMSPTNIGEPESSAPPADIPAEEDAPRAWCLYNFMRMPVEVIFSVDSYTSSSPDEEEDEDDCIFSKQAAMHGRDQIAEYAGEILERQHRCFLYSLYIYKEEFSIQLWDRNGMIMSSYENYKKDPLKLVRFLYYFGQMSDEQVGYDPTVTIEAADSPLVQEMKHCVQAPPSLCLNRRPVHV